MSYTEAGCGIEGRHWHTGEIVEGYSIDYWCPTNSAWVTEKTRTAYDRKCTCEEPHFRARIQHTMTEIIEIIDPAEYDITAWLQKKFKEHFLYYLLNGEEAYLEWAKQEGENDGHNNG